MVIMSAGSPNKKLKVKSRYCHPHIRVFKGLLRQGYWVLCCPLVWVSAPTLLTYVLEHSSPCMQSVFLHHMGLKDNVFMTSSNPLHWHASFTHPRHGTVS